MDKVQKTISGRASLKRLPEMTAKLNIRRPLIVGEEFLTGILLRRVPALLAAPVFSGFHSNPDLKDALAGAEILLKEECDGIVVIGGGSAMDTAKAVRTLLCIQDPEEAAKNAFPDELPDIRSIAIPATAGTGAEATQTAVVYMNGKKISLNHPYLKPDGVILDPDLLDSLPDYQKKSCALDALAQGIESYWCTSSTDDSRVHAYLAILGVLDNLKAYMAGDLHAAEAMMDAANQSGKAIQITRTTAAHAMSYQLTKNYGIAHGHAVMITLPVLWEMAAVHEEMTDVLQELTKIMRLGDPLMVPRLLRGIMIDLDMQIPDVPDQTTLEELADSVNTERLNNHPVRLSREEIMEAYRKAMKPMCAAERKACLDIWQYYNA